MTCFDISSTEAPGHCGRFGPFRSWLSVYLAGPRAARLGDALCPGMLGLSDPAAADRLWITAGKRDGLGWIVRALGRDRRDVQPVHDMLFASLEDPAWLGFNPWERRW